MQVRKYTSGYVFWPNAWWALPRFRVLVPFMNLFLPFWAILSQMVGLHFVPSSPSQASQSSNTFLKISMVQSCFFCVLDRGVGRNTFLERPRQKWGGPGQLFNTKMVVKWTKIKKRYARFHQTAYLIGEACVKGILYPKTMFG